MSNIVFFEMVPAKFYCIYSADPSVKVECTKVEICSNNPEILSWEGDRQYLKNFIEDFNLVCETKFSIGLIGSTYFFGEAVGSFLYTAFSVKY
jgi:hypothetical protein